MTKKKKWNKKTLFRSVPITYGALTVGYAFEVSTNPIDLTPIPTTQFSLLRFLSLLSLIALTYFFLIPENPLLSFQVIDILPSLSYPLDWLSLSQVPNFLI